GGPAGANGGGVVMDGANGGGGVIDGAGGTGSITRVASGAGSRTTVRSRVTAAGVAGRPQDRHGVPTGTRRRQPGQAMLTAVAARSAGGPDCWLPDPSSRCSRGDVTSPTVPNAHGGEPPREAAGRGVPCSPVRPPVRSRRL